MVLMGSYIHISARKNKQSILKNGLIPTPIAFDHHKEYFGWEDALYLWGDVPDKNFKYMRDLIYSKLWLHPRNHFSQNIEKKGLYGYSFKDYKINHLKSGQQDIYDVYLVEQNVDGISGLHGQWGSESEFNTGYQHHFKYEHDDKPLMVTQQTIKNPKIIGEISYYIDKHKNLNFKLK
jgi:hypothetical protein